MRNPIAASLGELSDILARQSARACATFHRGVHPDAEPFGREVAAQLLKQLPELRRRLGTDVKAVFDGDPAAVSYEEVILCYPALVALTHYRLAHALLQLGVPILPRLISEAAHSATGIDIHPGAEIGEYFSIDHGTGVVIGETCVIGNHVRLYQGVTLGAKSFKFDAAGNILQEPRHPILEDNVVVYSNSSILGRVRIGHDTVVGGNVWQTTDLPALFARNSGPCERIDIRKRRRNITRGRFGRTISPKFCTNAPKSVPKARRTFSGMRLAAFREAVSKKSGGGIQPPPIFVIFVCRARCAAKNQINTMMKKILFLMAAAAMMWGGVMQ